MANLATLDLPTTLQDFAKSINYSRVLLEHIGRASGTSYQEELGHITAYMIRELETCVDAASQLSTLKLAAATRNLFELSFVVEYVCASDENMSRFIIDADIDQLEIMERLRTIDRQDVDHQANDRYQALERELTSRIANAHPASSKPLQPFDIAKAVNREADYKALYKVYSKMTHATAWAILGTCSWENMARLLLLKANGYAVECFVRIANKTGLATITMPKV